MMEALVCWSKLPAFDDSIDYHIDITFGIFSIQPQPPQQIDCKIHPEWNILYFNARDRSLAP
jgi:hypothetical protein